MSPPWKHVPSRKKGFGSIVGRIPTEHGLARLTIARSVPAAFAPTIEYAPKMVELLRGYMEDHYSRKLAPCPCIRCRDAAEILMDIDGSTKGGDR